MDKISNVKIISIDLFRTLINIQPGPEIIWKTFFKDRFPPDQSRKYWDRAEAILSRRWNDAGVSNHHFKNVRMVLEETFYELFTEINFDYDFRSATSFLINQHKVHQLYDDARPFLENAGKKFRICLSSDGDLDMLNDIKDIYHFDHVFASETLRTYKLNPQFFSYVIDHYQVKPADILHIGDSESDIVGPKQCGVLTCWLNRKHHHWKHHLRPDFEVSSLMDVMDLLT